MVKVLLETNRSGYSTDQISSTLTVGELIGILQDYDEDAEVYFSNDDGFTYGGLNYETVREEYEGDDDDE